MSALLLLPVRKLRVLQSAARPYLTCPRPPTVPSRLHQLSTPSFRHTTSRTSSFILQTLPLKTTSIMNDPQLHTGFKNFKHGDNNLDTEMAEVQQLVPLVDRSETADIRRQHERDTAMADADNSDDDDAFVDAEEDIMEDDIAIITPAQVSVVDMTSDIEDDEDDDEAKSRATTPDLFASTFGSRATEKKDEDDEAGEDGDGEDNENTIEHAEGCKDTNRRLSTPPLPEPDLVITGASSGQKPSPDGPAKTASRKFVDKEEGRIRPGPDLDRDLYEGMRAHWRFHDRVAHLIPRLHAPDFDWSRRYWIAVLNHEKVAKNAKSEKDFVWMKGNRLSTVKTIWHRYVETAAADPDPETTVLMLGHERLAMTDTMEECDFFGDRLVVLRAVEGPAELRKEKSLLEGLIKDIPEEIVIDDD